MLLINYHAVKAYGEMDIKLHTLSISALDGRDL
jgi:hypothetical protein